MNAFSPLRRNTGPPFQAPHHLGMGAGVFRVSLSTFPKSFKKAEDSDLCFSYQARDVKQVMMAHRNAVATNARVGQNPNLAFRDPSELNAMVMCLCKDT